MAFLEPLHTGDGDTEDNTEVEETVISYGAQAVNQHARDYGDVEWLKAHFNIKKPKNAFSRPSEIHSEMRQIIADNRKHSDLLLQGSCKDCKLVWKLPKYLASSLSSYMRDQLDGNNSLPAIIDMTEFDAYLVDILVDHFYYGTYDLSHPFTFNYTEPSEGPINVVFDAGSDIKVHFEVYVFAGRMGCETLMEMSLANLRESFLVKNMELEHFVDIASDVFTRRDSFDKEEKVRKLFATVGACWDDIWLGQGSPKYFALFDYPSTYAGYLQRARCLYKIETAKLPAAMDMDIDMDMDRQTPSSSGPVLPLPSLPVRLKEAGASQLAPT
ncbi:hypothetical protein K505DRAFT_340188 [Melanomma pulvis-pyrius CBS 109.77]|uniref:BTB domain-containing protein n=1 Tax=Melanomma pulvis-pyrius CBS 109.77 TaxID=1314802 RepID=A0A6A6X2Z2_9PLEO|nr:hypothetical protein K505DRAFT_340188 [Melanomma pulvis-pyrius CBS 109.77]